MRHGTRASLVLGLFTVLACGPDAGDELPGGLLMGLEPTDVGSPRNAPLAPWRIGHSPLFRSGGTDERESHLLGGVAAAGVRADGSVIVADALLGAVRVYEPSGDLRMQLGAVGDGPGEFRSPCDVLAGPADSISVWDQALWRTSVFSPEGEFVRSEAYDPTDPGLYPLAGMWPFELRLGDGGARLVRLIGKAGAKNAGASPEDSAEGLVGFALHLRGSSELRPVGSLPEQERVQVSAPWGVAELAAPLGGGPQVAMSRKGTRVCLGHSTFPEILCVDQAGGRGGAIWRSEARAVRADDPDLQAWRDEIMADYMPKVSEEETEGLLSQVPRPEAQPAFRRLHLDVSGHLWIELGRSEAEGELREYLILDRDLGVVGRLDVPSLRILEIGEDYLLGLRSDPMGREEVVMHSLFR